jgi:carboxylesterase type B
MGQILTVLICGTSLITAQTIRLPYDLSVEPVSDYTKSGDGSLAKPLLAYFAIPYAEPPVGTLRFQPPVAPKRGNGQLLKNLDFGKICPQDGLTEHQSEDCLTLSVFRPQSDDDDKKLPVLIWTHGGAFNSGSGGENGILASMIGNSPHDFIGVAFNYRLGALGFLPSQLTHEAGLLNLGLKDQRMAYEWVQKYIGLFGGDPDKVTVRW